MATGIAGGLCIYKRKRKSSWNLTEVLEEKQVIKEDISEKEVLKPIKYDMILGWSIIGQKWGMQLRGINY